MPPSLGKMGFVLLWFRSLVSPEISTPVLDQEQRRQLKILIWFVLGLMAIFFALVWIFWNSQGLHFWLQVLTGNWSPENADKVCSDKWKSICGFQFSLSVLIGIILNWLPLLAAIGLFIKFINPLINDAIKSRKELTMNFTKALAVKTATERRSVLSSLPPGDTPLKEKVKAAFDEAKVRWKEQLSDMIGEHNAQEIFREMDKEIHNIDTDNNHIDKPKIK